MTFGFTGATDSKPGSRPLHAPATVVGDALAAALLDAGVEIEEQAADLELPVARFTCRV